MQAALENDTDAALRQRVVDGEQAAFADLMRRYNRRLYRVARSILRDDAEAEDALQDAYLQAYRALPGFRGESSLATWLTRIVMNAALMRRRKFGADGRGHRTRRRAGHGRPGGRCANPGSRSRPRSAPRPAA
jgi:RNA polymerase sigma-70 factor (ECF subfamily)